MDPFQRTVLIAAALVLMITLIFIGITLSKLKDGNWPPIVPACPDYWIAGVGDASGACVNVQDLGICPPKAGAPHLVMDFSQPPFNGADGNCHKYTWAQKCKISWDGVTYGVSNPCT